MPRFEKWLTIARANVPADQVARAALAERLLAVSHYLDQALRGDEAESIHLLRVWTRRASAVLKLFEPALPESRQKKMVKVLRRFRRAAGKVRDCDIQLERLSREEGPAEKQIIKMLQRERVAARQKLKGLRRRWQHDGRLQQLIEQLLEKIAWPKRHSSREAPPFRTFYRQQLQPLATDLFALAALDLSDDRSLHALRIAGKRLRYALELAPAALPAQSYRPLYDELNESQDRLGEICDELAAIGYIEAALGDTNKKSHKRQLLGLLKRAQRRLKGLRAKLVLWWPKARKHLKNEWNAVFGTTQSGEFSVS